ncbi:MAG: lysylphosphatidylglycerol synthase transmembrane domain-containing protein [Erythrobacter sp.]|uniref:lysylphosphatidylglycerol synthase transmembrane domain-containing protein n=1 Tax=Erythrobacter sp. TaxID=1042 RepID=UPI002627A874|nr:lysylphosphatidylglycerol synthase transmembrane domain-containing protein [Erythrobacter sp.]MDJ0976996.1 lysylphosphatidylglycerol synthase transmembrane domain-containing protein [Erythrobacter sp.]
MSAYDRNQTPQRTLLTVVKAVFLIVVLIAAWTVIRSDVNELTRLLTGADPGLLALAMAFAALNIILTACSWRMLIADHQSGPGWIASARIFFPGQLGKYLPGSFWSFLASAELAKAEGMDRSLAIATMLVATMIGFGSGFFIAIPTLYSHGQKVGVAWAPLMSITIVAALFLWEPVRQRVMRVANIGFTVSFWSVFGSILLALIAWMAAGTHLVFIASALGADPGGLSILQGAGIYALAWCAGFLVFIAPAGFGAREGTMIVLLTLILPSSQALAIALLSRAGMTASDFLLGGAFLFNRPQTAVQGE